MTATELRPFRQRLEQMYARLGGDVSQLLRDATGAGDIANDQADPGMRESEEDLALTLLGPEQAMLGEVTAALDRIANGKFGICEKCGHRIAQPRLEALPYARYCVRCAKDAENGHK